MKPLKILVTGANGQLGQDLMNLLGGIEPKGAIRGRTKLTQTGIIEAVGVDIDTLDITKRDQVLEAFDQIGPDVVIHCAAYTATDKCETEPEMAFKVNAVGTRNIVEGARSQGSHVIYVSTDYVFDGNLGRPYVEWDIPSPVSVYGKSKLGGERELYPGDTIVRTSWVCGFFGANMVKTVLSLKDGSNPLYFVDDQFGCPTFTAELSVKLRDLAMSGHPGIFHVTNQGPTNWYEFVREIMDKCGGDKERINPIPTKDLDPPRPAPRPPYSVLDNAALRLLDLELLPHWSESLEALLSALDT
ncbi:MAG: dTDP-4-dehydrorhamnose reductase [Acidimicrobiales bacterium]|nr:dTDP-4-dehydrorhamnose reductase [Acidimicrobiales bacterium]